MTCSHRSWVPNARMPRTCVTVFASHPSVSIETETTQRIAPPSWPGLPTVFMTSRSSSWSVMLSPARAGDNITDQELLREVMNTVGKYGQLGGAIRCVVSVAMLTEGWDASTVTHVLGVRAFGTQLLCEQVIGRALRRQSYDLNEEGLFNVEYADVLGIPFDFTAQPVPVKPQPPRATVSVHAVRPD